VDCGLGRLPKFYESSGIIPPTAHAFVTPDSTVAPHIPAADRIFNESEAAPFDSHDFLS